MPSQVLSLGVLDNLSRLQGNPGDGLYTQTRALSRGHSDGGGRTRDTLRRKGVWGGVCGSAAALHQENLVKTKSQRLWVGFTICSDEYLLRAGSLLGTGL